MTSMLKENGETTNERERKRRNIKYMLRFLLKKKLYIKNSRKATGSGRKKPRAGESTKVHRQGNRKHAQKLEKKGKHLELIASQVTF